MAELSKELTEKLGALAGKWTAYAAFGSFLLYLLGYLTLRFQLSTYGVATNLDIFDEKYFFAGCRFLVYLVSAVPNVLILVLILWAIGYLPWKVIPRSLRDKLKSRVSGWSNVPDHLPLLGVILAVAIIQFVSRKCFAFGNLLLQKHPPDEWLTSLLLTSDAKLSLYFSGLLAGSLLTGGILLFVLQRGTATTDAGRFWVVILAFLVAVQLLLLPVNYGVLISTQQLPRVAAEANDEKADKGRVAWLVWDSKYGDTYLVLGPDDQRMLVTSPKTSAEVKIVAYDDIFCILFAANHSGSRPCAM